MGDGRISMASFGNSANIFIKNCNPYIEYWSNKTWTFEVRTKVPNYIIYDQKMTNITAHTELNKECPH